MIFSIPIYIEERTDGINLPVSFIVRPLFHSEPVQRADKLGRALSKLTNDLQQLLYEAGRDPRHDRLAQWNFHPLLEETTLDLRLELGSGSHLKRFFLAGYPALDRKLFFTPALPNLHFEIFPGQSIAERATAVFTRYFRDLEKDGETVSLEDYALQGKGRLTTIEISLKPSALAKKPKRPERAMLFGSNEKKDGEQELRKTGRTLQSLYPDDLDRALGHEHEVEELARLLASTDRRPILLVGPRKVGKTTILHELVRRMCARKKERFGGRREIWQLSPMRLISGMSYLGEWENRVLAILDYAHEKDRVLYFDDLPGLLSAGVSCASDLNVAQVLRPALEKRRVRLLAEITPEAWRVLRERDRAFADLFHIIPITEPPEPETLRVLIDITGQLEEQYRCEFAVEVVPTVYDLHRRFASDAAFPGKAAGFLRRLAVRHSRAAIARSDALNAFHEQSGMQLAFLDENKPMERSSILRDLRAELAGQDLVLEAFADILMALKTRLNDPRRPLGALLLLGPTGVGKTQSAKALAKFLFGSAERLLRFDMNEFVEASSAGRLAGTLEEPEGLLTGAIRRQPFAVVLFDEIEKAAPEVFDLLLAVLDEGRLTDTLGRVADFTNAVILLTSNLGVREAHSQLGFGAANAKPEVNDAVFASAAEKFFRPEFFNRLDRIIPFRSLETAHLEKIAHQLIANVFSRDGLRQRDCLLRVSPDAMAQLVELGRDPKNGARALKRIIEQNVAQPLAEHLAGLPPGTPSIASFEKSGISLTLKMRDLKPVAREIVWPEIAVRQSSSQLMNLIDGANAALDRIEADLEVHAPVGKIELENMPPESARYFACREQLKKIDRLIQALEKSGIPRKTTSAGRVAKPKPTKIVVRQQYTGNPRFGRLRERVGLQIDLADWESGETVEATDSPALALCRELALLEAMVRKPWNDHPLVLVIRPLDERDAETAFRLAQFYFDFFNYVWGGSATRVFRQPVPEELLLLRIFSEKTMDPFQALFLHGFNLRLLLGPEPSTVLTRRKDGSLGILLTHGHDVSTLAESEAIARSYLPSEGKPVPMKEEDLGPVVKMINENQSITDCRSGMVIPVTASVEEFRALMLSALPLPPEVVF